MHVDIDVPARHFGTCIFDRVHTRIWAGSFYADTGVQRQYGGVGRDSSLARDRTVCGLSIDTVRGRLHPQDRRAVMG
jgi:hypothetical protein